MGIRFLASGTELPGELVELKRNDELLWSEGTGRAATSGLLIGSVVAEKRKWSLKWGVMKESAYRAIKSLMPGGFFSFAAKYGEQETSTASGSVITVDDAADVQSLTIHGKSTQDGTPSPSSPVPIESVPSWNMLDPSVVFDDSAYYTVNSDGSVTVTANDSRAWSAITTLHLEAGYYIVTRSVKMGTVLGYSMVDGATSTAVINMAATSDGGTFQLTSAADIAIKLGNSASSYPFTTTVQITKAWLAKPFVPYGSVPILTQKPNLAPFFARDFTDVFSASNIYGYWQWGGSALSHLTQLEDGWARFEYDNTTTSSQYIDLSIKAPALGVFEGGTYTMLVEYRNYSKTGGNFQTIFSVDNTPAYSQLLSSGFAVNTTMWNSATEDSGKFYLTSAAQSSFDVANKLCRMFFQVWSGCTVSVELRASLYSGDYSGDFVPYEEPTITPVDLDGNLLCSLPDGTEDVLTVDSTSCVITASSAEYTFTGSETVSLDDWRSASGTYAAAFPISMLSDRMAFGASTVPNAMMEYLEPNTYNNIYNGAEGFALSASASDTAYSFFVRVSTDVASTKAELLAWLAGKRLIYPLASEQTISLDPVSLPSIPEDGSMWVEGTTVDATLLSPPASTIWSETAMVYRSEISGELLGRFSDENYWKDVTVEVIER